MIDFGNRYVQAGMIFFVMFLAIPTFWDVVLSSPSNVEGRIGTPSQIREASALIVPLRLHEQSNRGSVRQAFIKSYRKCAKQHTEADLPDYVYDGSGEEFVEILVFEKEFDPDSSIDHAADLMKKLTREPDHIERAAHALLRKLQSENMIAEMALCSLRLTNKALEI